MKEPLQNIKPNFQSDGLGAADTSMVGVTIKDAQKAEKNQQRLNGSRE